MWYCISLSSQSSLPSSRPQSSETWWAAKFLVVCSPQAIHYWPWDALVGFGVHCGHEGGCATILIAALLWCCGSLKSLRHTVWLPARDLSLNNTALSWEAFIWYSISANSCHDECRPAINPAFTKHEQAILGWMYERGGWLLSRAVVLCDQRHALFILKDVHAGAVLMRYWTWGLIV
jgi:hypothetical protein